MSRPPTLLEMRSQARLMRDEAAAAIAAGAAAVDWGPAAVAPAQLSRWADAIDRAADRVEATPGESRRREQALARDWNKGKDFGPL